MPQIVHESPRLPKPRILIIGSIVVTMLAIIALAVFWYVGHQGPQDEERYNTMIATTEKLQSRFKYAEARQVAADYAKTSPTPVRRCEALRREGGYSLQLKDASGATSAYKELHQTEGCSKFKLTAVQGLSAAAIMAGDKTSAIAYLKEEITLWPANAELREMYVRDLKNRIKTLGGQP